MWGNQLSDNYNTTTEFVNERKKTNFVKHSEQWDYLNRIEMKKNKPMNMFIWEHRMSKCLFFFCLQVLCFNFNGIGSFKTNQ